jgi:hypothetical protein
LHQYPFIQDGRPGGGNWQSLYASSRKTNPTPHRISDIPSL